MTSYLRRRVGSCEVDYARDIHVMAIVNRTPDSFHDRGATVALDAAINAGRRAVDAGADWVDIGGIPFSPDTPAVDEPTELDRVVPVVEALSATGAIIAVDTWRPAVAQACLAAGALVINDTSNLHDLDVARVAADTGAQLVVCHCLAAPHEHLPRPHYDDVIADVRARLDASLSRARGVGVRDDQLIVDPGPDLNKTTRHTLELLRGFSSFTQWGLPVLVAVSNKDVIGETLGRPRDQRVVGSVAAAAWCLAQGGSILRVHDVAAGVDTARMVSAIRGWHPPAYERHNLG